MSKLQVVLAAYVNSTNTTWASGGCHKLLKGIQEGSLRSRSTESALLFAVNAEIKAHRTHRCSIRNDCMTYKEGCRSILSPIGPKHNSKFGRNYAKAQLI